MRICRENNPIRRYLQYNDIIIASADELSSASLKWDTKGDTHEWSFGHGSYYPLKDEQLFLTEQNLSLSLNIDFRHFPRENRRFINDFMTMNLIKPGKLWAIQDGVLIWAYAYLESGGEEYEKYVGYLTKDVEFVLPEGYWHIAKKRRTFLLPYDSCNVTDCYDFRDIDDCLSCCILCSTDAQNSCSTCFCDCGDAVEENSLCGMKQEDLDQFSNCGKSYKIIYDCNAGRKIFGERDWGTKISKESLDSTLIAGRVHSNTILDTDRIDVVLTGEWQDPKITINDISITVKGDYNGWLKLRPDGTVYFTDDLCCDFEPVNMDDIEYHQKRYFKVHFGKNRVIAENSCCGEASIYIDIDEIKP